MVPEIWPVVREPRGKTTTIMTLINWSRIQLPSRYLSIHPYISSDLASARMLPFVVGGGEHRQPQIVEVQKISHGGMFILKWHIYLKLTPKTQGISQKMRQKYFKSQRVERITAKRFLLGKWVTAHVNSQHLWLPPDDLYKIREVNSPAWMWGTHWAPLLVDRQL